MKSKLRQRGSELGITSSYFTFHSPGLLFSAGMEGQQMKEQLRELVSVCSYCSFLSHFKQLSFLLPLLSPTHFLYPTQLAIPLVNDCSSALWQMSHISHTATTYIAVHGQRLKNVCFSHCFKEIFCGEFHISGTSLEWKVLYSCPENSHQQRKMTT